MDVVRVSKRLSYVLRHHPDSVGIQLDGAGWVDVGTLLAALAAHGLRLTRAELEHVVATNDTRRFAFDPTGRRIRASQGHSVGVDLGYQPVTPPDVLFHGTPARNVDAILREGLRAGKRHGVHLSPDVPTARKVGERRGRAVVLRVDAARLAASPSGVHPLGEWRVAGRRRAPGIPLRGGWENVHLKVSSHTSNTPMTRCQ